MSDIISGRVIYEGAFDVHIVSNPLDVTEEEFHFLMEKLVRFSGPNMENQLLQKMLDDGFHRDDISNCLRSRARHLVIGTGTGIEEQRYEP